MALVKRKRESSPSPSSSSTRQPKYDVFLSFRGEDTRTNFTDHLYDALKRKGINTFRDEEELKKGKRISELFKAIEESQFAIIILSINYASSTWCLDEVVKIIKCKDEIGLEVLPVFYNVSPSIVQKQTETFEQAFIDHQKRFEDNIEKVETWRTALREVADIKGCHLQKRLESEIIQDIVKVIMEKLSSKSSSIDKNLIGIKSMMEELIPSYLGFGNDIYMMGIFGMGGLGKTTLAYAIYKEYSGHFDGSSFIADVREMSEKRKLKKLQQQLLDEILRGSDTMIYNVHEGVDKIKSRLRYKKVLLVLDDVNDVEQLEKLAGEGDWFGSGSWIIITTRDERVFVNHEGLKKYKPNGLNDDNALKLFCLKAFKKVQPEEGYEQLSRNVVNYASGLPLALVTLGPFLAKRPVQDWQSALDSLKHIKGDIYNILKISYDGLEEMWKEIFLDIACFFRWRNKDEVIEILENCGLNAKIGISVLVEKSLLTLENGGKCLTMHDLLQEMGKKIVLLKSGGNLVKQSRLWLNKDLLYVLKNNMATEAIQAITFNRCNEDINLEDFSEGFSKMPNLKFLRIDRVNSHNAQRHLTLPINLKYLRWIGCLFKYLPNLRFLRIDRVDSLNAQRHLILPNNLRYLRWIGCPFKCLASSHKQQMREFVHLDLQFGQIEYLGEGVMRSVNLKYIDLSSSRNLVRTPDFSGVPKLEELRLSYCHRLVEIHPSIGQLSRLRYLDLELCDSLTDLPRMSSKMQSLKVLNLAYCVEISSFPKFEKIMESLSTLNLAYTGIKKVEPSSIECLPALTFLDLSACSLLECLPSNMDKLTSIETLNLSKCVKLKSFPRLPSAVRFVGAKGCSSLKWSSKRVKLSIWSQPFSQWLPYDESRSRVGFTKLFHFLQGLLCRKVVFDGSIIPSCLAEIKRNSISIELPSNWYNSKWIGFALWASLFGVEDAKYGIRAHVIALGNIPLNYCASEHFTTYISDENSICLLYLSRDDWFAKVGNGACSQINVRFEAGISKKKISGKCGVSLIYKQDENEFNQTNAQCLIKSFGEEVCIYKLTAGDDDDDVHIVNNDDDDDVYIVRDDVHIVNNDDDDVLIFGDDDFDDGDI